MTALRNWLGRGTPMGLLLLAFVVGMGGAVGAALFHLLIAIVTAGFFGVHGNTSFLETLETMPVWQRLLIPTLGGLFVGVIYSYTKVSEAEGEGVPEVMEALAHKRGNIRPVVAPVKILTAAITLGSGGSAGREGPVIQIGSTVGSSVAQWFRLATEHKGLLLGAGAAAAIGGTFGAPIAGILFTIEILRHRPKTFNVMILTIAAFTGAIGTRLLTGHEGLRFPSDIIFSITPHLVIVLLVLSTVATFVALSFGQILRLSHEVFKNLALPHITKPAFGGLAIGIISLFIPHIHEPAAYPLMIDLISLVSLPLSFLFFLLLIKMIATGITLGSGGSGGVFAPLLLMGAITGTVVGGTAHLFGVLELSSIPILVFIGMATTFAAAAHAPLTAAFITYEMTGGIELIIPLLIACIVASSLSKKINPRSLYHHE